MTVIKRVRKQGRRWSDEQKKQILAACAEPGAVVANVARNYGVSASQIYGWRKASLPEQQGGFLPVTVDMGDEPPSKPDDGQDCIIEACFSNGHRLKIPVLAQTDKVWPLIEAMAAL